MPPSPERVLSFPDALAVVLEHARSLPAPWERETVPLLAAAGRVLAEPISAERDHPPFPRSTRDGFALRAADLASALHLEVVGSLRAGERYTGTPFAAGQALEIMTGAPVPPGADAVLMLEHALLQERSLSLAPGRTLAAGENVVPRASEARAGAELVPRGRRMAAPEIALAASCGRSELQVFHRPEVAIAATGDELVELDAAPAPWQIRNSNTYALSALVHETGGSPVPLPVARDTLSDLEARLRQALPSDVLLLSGGVSMGKYDLVEEVLGAHGAEFLFTGTLIQPGKPLVFGRLPRERVRRVALREHRAGESPGTDPSELGTGESWQYFFGLPGNPVSTEVCFRLFVAPFLQTLAGETAQAPRFVEARLTEDVRAGSRVTRFLPAFLSGDWQSAKVTLVPWQGSGDLAANARANCFAVLPADHPPLPAGSTVRILLR